QLSEEELQKAGITKATIRLSIGLENLNISNLIWLQNGYKN
ncbi:hypothetical protein, partial [Campylobacter jejuni]